VAAAASFSVDGELLSFALILVNPNILSSSLRSFRFTASWAFWILTTSMLRFPIWPNALPATIGGFGATNCGFGVGDDAVGVEVWDRAGLIVGTALEVLAGSVKTFNRSSRSSVVEIPGRSSTSCSIFLFP